ncbi:MAG: AAA family ATPase [Methanolinea sp.]|jgi:SpoVK/Ycf46/Vps4 family AAA+-type ATPase|nr:AAA family ATPase [Methanolinea sp.]
MREGSRDQEIPVQIDLCLRARITLLILHTPEEERAIRMLQEVCTRWSPPRPFLTWDLVEGFSGAGAVHVRGSGARDPLQALDEMEKTDEAALIVLKDFHEFWGNPGVKRKLRNLAQKFRFSRRTMVVITPALKVPEEIRDDAVVLHVPPPSAGELELELDRLLRGSGVPDSLTPLGREKLIQAALGMSLNQACRSFSKAIVRHGRLDDRDIDEVVAEKKDILSQSEALEFYSATEAAENVGGLAVLKEWLRLRERAFSREARDYGLPSPKGIALIGIPGTGKSLTAKMIAGMWRLPLLRLDVGALFGSFVGESEERTRRALSLAETISPCILWIDEMEKAFSFGNGDSGTSQRVFASILTWMQDKTSPCFVVATANDISALPPELLRKGRFDEVFFLDLPSGAERKEIFSVHLRRRGFLPDDFDLETLARISEGYVGAEIEQTVIDAMYQAFNQEMRRITTGDIISALKTQVPLSISQKEVIGDLRAWLVEGRALSASAPFSPAESTGGAIHLEPVSSPGER